MFADEHQLQGGSHRTFYFYTNGLHVKNGTEVPFQEDDSEGRVTCQLPCIKLCKIDR